jgi:hypothetical protein
MLTTKSETKLPRLNMSWVVALCLLVLSTLFPPVFGQAGEIQKSIDWTVRLHQLGIRLEGLSSDQRESVQREYRRRLKENSLSSFAAELHQFNVAKQLLTYERMGIKESPQLKAAMASIERVIKENEEPSYLLCRENVCIDDSGIPRTKAKNAARAKEVLDFEQAHGSALKAIGAIEVSDRSGVKPVGTATLIDGGFLITNRHVAIELVGGVFKDVPGSKLKRSLGGFENKKVTITFGRRDIEPNSNLRKIQLPSNLFFYYPEDDCDIAIFKVPGLDSIKPVRLPGMGTDAMAEGESILVLGYPADLGTTPPSEADRVFGIPGVQEVLLGLLRASPGRILSTVRGDGLGSEISYNAQTCEGSSGSPVFRQRDGALIAIHSGSPEYDHTRNIGVPIIRVRELLQVVSSL